MSRIAGILEGIEDIYSRMQRANNQGFDTDRVLYHHTDADNIEEFVPSAKGKLGAGIYTSPNPQYGERYADNATGTANVLPLYARGPIAKAADIDAASSLSRDMLSAKGRPFGAQEWKATTNNILKEQGFTGKEVAEEVSIFDPENVRSVNAAFNPNKSDSKNILAGAGGLGLLGAGMLGSDNAEAGPLTSGARRLIDARFSSPVGGGNERKGVLNAVETMQTGITPRNMDTGGEVNLYDFEGSPYILTQSDRSAAGGLLNSIHDADIDAVDLRGGRDFMFDPSSQGQVWASDPNVVKSLQKRAAQLKSDYGSDPLLLPYTMAPTGIDFATMPLDTMINFARQGMSKSNIKKLDKQIKGVIPQWTSVSDPSANAIFREVKGPSRKKVADLIDKNFRDVKGGLSISEARAATTDASQYVEKEGTLKNIGRIDTSAGLIADSGHPTYIGGLPGEGVGTLKDALNARVLMEQNGRVLANDMSDIRALSMNHGLSQGIIDDSLLRRIYDNKDKVAAGSLGVAGPSLANASTDNAKNGLLGSLGDAGLEAMSGVNRAVVDGLNFLTADQINALLNISGSEKRIPDLYDIEGVEEATQGNYMEPGLLRDIIRQGSEFLSPI